jgi:hypothetical protein
MTSGVPPARARAAYNQAVPSGRSLIVTALAAVIASGGCGSSGACLAGSPTSDAGSATFAHCDDGVSSQTCASNNDGARFVNGKSCRDLGYTIPCAELGFGAGAQNCFLYGGPSDASATSDAASEAAGN